MLAQLVSARGLFLLSTVVLVAVCAPAVCAPAPRPQDASTNNIIPQPPLAPDEGESLVASLILAVAEDWDLGRVDPTQFVRAVPAMTANGTISFGPTTHPITQNGPISFSESPEEKKSKQ